MVIHRWQYCSVFCRHLSSSVGLLTYLADWWSEKSNISRYYFFRQSKPSKLFEPGMRFLYSFSETDPCSVIRHSVDKLLNMEGSFLKDVETEIWTPVFSQLVDFWNSICFLLLRNDWSYKCYLWFAIAERLEKLGGRTSVKWSISLSFDYGVKVLTVHSPLATKRVNSDA